MLRPISICALLCSIAHQGLGTPVMYPIFSRIIETRLPNPVTISMDSTLYTISKTNRTLSINSTEVTCKLATDPFDEMIRGRIRAVPLIDARKIVVWGIQSSNLEGDVRSTFYTLLIVDPLACSYKVVPLPEDKLPANWPLMLPQLVAYGKEFYVFFPTHQKCSPCFFDSTGYQNSWLNGQLQWQNGVPSKQFLIKEFFTNNYRFLFHAYNFENGTALIELVDNSRFTSVTRIYVNHTVDAASVAYGAYQNTAICYISNANRQEVTCARLNRRLVPGISWKLPASILSVSDVSIEVDKLGNTFIGTVNLKKLSFFIYNVDGQLVADLHFGQLSKVYTYREVNGVRIGDEYCLDAVAYLDDDAQQSQNVVKCVDIQQYIQSV